MVYFSNKILLIFIFLFYPQIFFAQDSIIEKKVNELLKKMTLEEKIGQLNQYNGFWDLTGPVPENSDAQKKYKDIKSGRVGSMLNIYGVENVKRIQKLAVENSRLGIPLIFGFDVIHGYRTMFPIPLAEAASWDLKAIEKSARIAAIEASAVGINWTFAPMVDISRDARWGRIMEGAGEDSYLGSKVAVARVQGFQTNDLSADNSIAACAKHFAAYGFVEAGKEYNTVDIGTSTLYNVVLPPFKACVDANVQTFMNAFNTLNGIPSTGNSFLLRKILKGDWNFNGFVVSDWASGAEMVAHGYAKDLKQAAKLAMNAGSDMDMESYIYTNYLKDLVIKGEVPEAAIDESVKRVLRVKFNLGLFDNPYKYCDFKRENKVLNNREHQKAALDIAKKSIVLLKNNQNLLPLKKSGLKIAVIGALADDKDSPLGSWRARAEKNSSVSVLEGLAAYKANVVNYAKGPVLWLNEPDFINEIKINESDTAGFNEASDLAEKSDIVIMVLGEHAFMSGEGRSRTNLDLPGLQQELLEEVYKVNKNIVLVLMNGRPLTISWADEHLPAILECWQLGSQSGNAIAQVLYGDYNPSGKLPVSFPRSVGQVPIYYNHYSTGRGKSKDIVFWSHYTDEQNTPLYPFGFGLSYTSFKYSDLEVDTTDMEHIKISVQLINTGNREGEEVVQLYISDKYASVVRPVKELKGFKKMMLKPGESKIVKFVLTKNELGFFNNQGRFIVEPGEFEIMVGSNSVDLLKKTFFYR